MEVAAALFDFSVNSASSVGVKAQSLKDMRKSTSPRILFVQIQLDLVITK